MNSGRVDRNYVWPHTLRVPARPPQLVYLDLNHWINLSRAFSGHRDGEKHKDILDFCLKSVERKTAVFYIEIQKTGDYQKRCNLREVIERLSQYMVVLPRHIVAAHESEAVWDQIIGPNSRPINDMNYLDRGVLRSVGLEGGIRIMSSNNEDITTEFRRSYVDGPEVFDEKVSEVMLEFERQMIEGPSPEEEEDFRKSGYSPEVTLEQYEQEAEHEAELVGLLDDEPKWRNDRLYDVVSARELLFHINHISKRGCIERGINSLDEVFHSVGDPRAAFGSMPSFDASVTLKTFLHKNAKHRWSNNDIYDIHALAITLPYCDIVVTDRAMAARAVQSKLAGNLKTIVLHRLSDLHQYL